MKITDKEDFKTKIKAFLDNNVDNDVVEAIVTYYKSRDLPDDTPPDAKEIQELLFKKTKEWLGKYQKEINSFFPDDSVLDNRRKNYISCFNGFKESKDQIIEKFTLEELKLLWRENGQDLNPSAVKRFALALRDVYDTSNDARQKEILRLINKSGDKLIPEMAGHTNILVRIIIDSTEKANEDENLIHVAQLAFNNIGVIKGIFAPEILKILWGEDGKGISNLEGFVVQLENAYKQYQSDPKQLEQLEIIMILINQVSTIKQKLSPESAAVICMLQAIDQMKQGKDALAINYIAQGFNQFGENKEQIAKFNQKLEEFGMKKNFNLEKFVAQVSMPVDVSASRQVKQQNEAIVKALITVPAFWNELLASKDAAITIEILLANYGDMKIDNKSLLVIVMNKISNTEFYQNILETIPNYLAQVKLNNGMDDDTYLAYAMQIYIETGYVKNLLEGLNKNEKSEKLLDLVENDKAFAEVILKDSELNQILKEKDPDLYGKMLAENIAFKIVPSVHSNNPADELFREGIGERYKKIDNNNLEILLKSEKIPKEDILHRQAILRAMIFNAEPNDKRIIYILENLSEYNLENDNILNDSSKDKDGQLIESTLSKQVSDKFPEQLEKLTSKERETEVVPQVEELTTKFEREVTDTEIEEEARKKTNQKAFVEFTHEALKDMSISALKEILIKSESAASIESRLNILELIISKDQSVDAIQDIIDDPQKYHLNLDIFLHATLIETASVEQLKALILKAGVNNVMTACTTLLNNQMKAKAKLVGVIFNKDIIDKAEIVYRTPAEKNSVMLLEQEIRRNLSGQKDDLITTDSESFEEGSYDKVSPFMRAVALMKWMTALYLGPDELREIYSNTQSVDILNAIKLAAHLGENFIKRLDIENDTSDRQAFISLLKCKYPTSIYVTDPNKLIDYDDLQKLTETEISEILDACSDTVKEVIRDNVIIYNAEKSPQVSLQFRLEILKQFVEDISKDFQNQSTEEQIKRLDKLGVYINSYKSMDLLDINNNKAFIPVLREIFAKPFMENWELFHGIIDLKILDVLIDSCVENPEDKASQTILDNLVKYAFEAEKFDAKSEALIKSIRHKLTGAWVTRYASELTSKIGKEGTVEDYAIVGVELRRILENPESVAKLQKEGQFEKAINDYLKISKFLMAVEYREMQKLAKGQQAKADNISKEIKIIDQQLDISPQKEGEEIELAPMGKSKQALEKEKAGLQKNQAKAQEMANYFDSLAKNVKSFRAAESMEVIASRLQESLKTNPNISPEIKEKVLEILKPYLTDQMKEARVFAPLNWLYKLIVGKPRGDLEEEERSALVKLFKDVMSPYGDTDVSRNMEMPAGVAKEGDKIYDVNKNELGFITKNGEIHVDDEIFEKWKNDQKADALKVRDYRLTNLSEYKEVMIDELKRDDITDQEVIEKINTEYQNRIKLIDAIKEPSLLQMGTVKIGTVLYDKDGKYLGTLNAQNTIEQEFLVGADIAQDILLDEELFGTIDPTRRNQLFKRIIDLDGLPDFIARCGLNPKLFQALIQYLIDEKPQLKPLDWKSVVRWADESQINNIFDAYNPNIIEKLLKGNDIRRNDREGILFALLSNSSKLDDFCKKFGEDRIVEMHKDTEPNDSTVNKWIASDEISYRGKNLSRVYLLSDESYVNKIKTTNTFKQEVAELYLDNLSSGLIKGLNKSVRIELIASGNFNSKIYHDIVHDFSSQQKNEAVTALIKSMAPEDAVVWVMKEVGNPINRTLFKDYTKAIITALLSRPSCVKLLASIEGIDKLQVKDKSSMSKITERLKTISDRHEMKVITDNIPNLMKFIAAQDEKFLKDCFKGLGQASKNNTSQGRKNAVLELSNFFKARRGYLSNEQKKVSKNAGAEAGGPGRPLLQRLFGRSHEYVASKETKKQREDRKAAESVRKESIKAASEKATGKKKDNGVLQVKTTDRFSELVQKEINEYIISAQKDCYVPAFNALLMQSNRMSQSYDKLTQELKDLEEKNKTLGEDTIEKLDLEEKIKDIRDRKLGIFQERARLSPQFKALESSTAWALLIMKDESMVQGDMKNIKNIISPEIMKKYDFDPAVDLLNIANLIELAAILESDHAAEALPLGTDIKALRERVARSMEKRLNLYEDLNYQGKQPHSDLLYDFLNKVFAEKSNQDLIPFLDNYKLTLPKQPIYEGHAELLGNLTRDEHGGWPEHVKPLVNMYDRDKKTLNKNPVLGENQKPQTYMIAYVHKHLGIDLIARPIPIVAKAKPAPKPVVPEAKIPEAAPLPNPFDDENDFVVNPPSSDQASKISEPISPKVEAKPVESTNTNPFDEDEPAPKAANPASTNPFEDAADEPAPKAANPASTNPFEDAADEPAPKAANPASTNPFDEDIDDVNNPFSDNFKEEPPVSTPTKAKSASTGNPFEEYGDEPTANRPKVEKPIPTMIERNLKDQVRREIGGNNNLGWEDKYNVARMQGSNDTYKVSVESGRGTKKELIDYKVKINIDRTYEISKIESKPPTMKPGGSRTQ